MLTLEALRTLSPERAGKAILETPEDQWFDRKSSRIEPRKLAESLVAMANAEGGLVIVGVHDGELAVTPPKHVTNALRQTAADYTEPVVPHTVASVRVAGAAGQTDVLAFDIPASDRIHATSKDVVFLRVGDENRKLTYEQRRELEFDKGQSNFERTPSRFTEFSDLNQGLLEHLAHELGSSDGESLLQARGLLADRSRLTAGAVLLFARHPQAEFPEAHLRVIRHQGTARATGRRQQIVLDERIEGGLSQQIEQAMTVVDSVVPQRRALGPEGKFVEVHTIPRDAWLEGIVNAVIHRSYSMIGDHTRIEIFDDRLEITSPGRFPGVVNLEHPEEINRFARNPRIARVLSDLHFGQELGEGIRRMFDEMRLAGLAQPVYHQTSGSVRLTLMADAVDRALEDRLSADARVLVRAIREAGRLSTGDLVDVSRRSRPAVLSDLKTLREAGVVEWVGKSPKDPRAFWRIPS